MFVRKIVRVWWYLHFRLLAYTIVGLTSQYVYRKSKKVKINILVFVVSEFKHKLFLEIQMTNWFIADSEHLPPFKGCFLPPTFKVLQAASFHRGMSTNYQCTSRPPLQILSVSSLQYVCIIYQPPKYPLISRPFWSQDIYAFA